jgi:integration host factor subunit alpha
MALTKAEIIDHLSREIGINKREAKEIVELFFQTVSTALTKGHQVKLSGFGNFTLHDKSERPGRNPKTGEEIPVSARRVATFRSGQKLRARVGKFEGRKETK